MIKPFLTFCLVTGLLILFFVIYFPLYSRYRELKIYDESLAAKLDKMNSEIARLSEERNLLKNDVAYLEKVIRQEMGLAKPGETVYKFVTEPAKTAKTADTAELPLAGAELSGP